MVCFDFSADENTTFDATAGLAAGAFGQPNRYGGGAYPNGSEVLGNWERTISIYRSTYSSVVQARGWLPDSVGGTVWWGPHAAHATCYAPLPIGLATAVGGSTVQLPHRYTIGYQSIKDDSALWAFRFVENLAQIRFSSMMLDIRAAQTKWEARALLVQATVDAEVLAQLHAPPDLTAYVKHANGEGPVRFSLVPSF
jgi:dipeptidase